jgi:hypothetical protein
MNIRSIPWREVVPWTALVAVLSCGSKTVAPVTPANQTSFKSLETEEIVLRGKDGTPRGRLTADNLVLSDAVGNMVAIALDGKTAKIVVSNAKTDFGIIITAEAEASSVLVTAAGKSASLSLTKEGADISVSAAGRRITAGVDVEHPQADLEFFDANEKRRVSVGLNSNGDPRISLYDANQTRRFYGILFEDVAMLDLNNKMGDAAVELFGADAKRGSGMSVVHPSKTTNVGLGPDGKPLK